MSSLDLLQGTLDLLILQVLRREPMHGWGIAQRILEGSSRQLNVNQGSLYPALHRLEDRGLVRASWGTSENNRRARFYELTAAGRRQLKLEQASWQQFAGAVQGVLQFV
ncbi:MAG: PadR family transcriptional regulator [Gemmatimonadales bacterium]